MNLLESTKVALDFTTRLKAALALGELEMCQEILDLRGQAMQSFEKSHRRASSQEIMDCRDEIAALAEADLELQNNSAQGLEATARDFREKTVSNVQGNHQLYQHHFQILYYNYYLDKPHPELTIRFLW